MTMDFCGLADRLLADADRLLAQWLPAGKRIGAEYRVGSLAGEAGQSLSINVRTGRWADFHTGERGGDLIDLYAAIHGLELGEAYRELDGSPGVPAAGTVKPRPVKPARQVIMPAPAEDADCDCIHPDYGAPTHRWTYFDGNGEVLGYVARYEPKGTRKQIIPWTYTSDGWGRGQWPAPRPLYRLNELEARSSDPVLILEGEKATDAAAQWAEPYVTTTWPGGAQALHLANWSVLRGRKILLWPDADEAGAMAMLRLADILRQMVAEIKIVDTTGQRDGWDAADAGFRTWAEARAWLQPRVRVLDAPEPPPPPPPPPAPPPEDLRDAAARANEHAAAEQAVEREEFESLLPAQWFQRFAFLLASADFFDVKRRKLVERKSFDAVYRHHKLYSIHTTASGGSSRVTASFSYDENRIAMKGRTLAGLIYSPGNSVFVEHEGDVFGNTWRDGRPAGKPGSVDPWLEHAERMIPDEQEREHCFNWMAYKVQYPARKINHGILHGGRQGSGKDTLWLPFLYSVGGRGWQNVKTVTTEEIQSNFHYHLLSEVCVLNELREPALADRRALENKLKPLLAAPPETFSINEKGRHPYPAVNRLSVLGFSNERISLSLSADDRRWMVLWSEAGILPQDEASTLWTWYEQGGLDHVAHWLRTRDVSAFKPGERPLMTDAKAVMLEGGLSPGEALLAQAMRDRTGPFRAGAVMGPWQPLVDQLQQEQQQHKLSIQSLYVAAQHAGWMDLGKIKAPLLPTKKHILCSPETLEKYGNNRAEIRRILETLGPRATVHEFRRASGD